MYLVSSIERVCPQCDVVLVEVSSRDYLINSNKHAHLPVADPEGEGIGGTCTSFVHFVT